MRYLAVALLLAISGCNCGNNNSSDAGTDSGVQPQGDAGPPDAGAFIAWSDFCGYVGRGITHAIYLHATQCGDAVLPTELQRLPETHYTLNLASRLADYSCAPGSALALDLAKFNPGVAAGRIAYDGASAYQCFLMGRDAGSGPFLNPQHRLAAMYVDGGVTGPCEAVLKGTVAVSGACQINEECAGDGVYCKPAGTGTCGGTCQPLLGLDAGCDPALDLCVPEANCLSFTSAPNRCVKVRALAGEACNVHLGSGTFVPCLEGFACIAGAQPDGGAACGLPSAPGQGCHDVATSTDCQTGLGCVAMDGGTALCQPPAKLGEACGGDGTAGLPRCESCFSCTWDGGIAPAGTQGLCGPAIGSNSTYIESVGSPGIGATGAHCPSGVNDCDSYNYCDAGICQIRSRHGESCGRTGTNYRGSCLYVDDYCVPSAGPGSPGICGSLPDAGEPCGNDAVHSPYCLTGLWCANPGDGGTATCQGQGLDGQPCGQDNAPPGCANGEACDRISDGGGICTNNAGKACVNNCVANYFCARPDGGASFCLPVLASGQACGVDGGFGSAACASGFCSQTTGICEEVCTNRTSSEGVGPGLGLAQGGPTGVSCYSCQKGGRDYAYYLIFALFLAPGMRSRKGRKPKREA